MHCELADQTDADHRRGIAKLKAEVADRVQRDRRESAEACFFVVDVVRNRCRKAVRHKVDLGVVGVPGAGHSYALADTKPPFSALAHRFDNAGGRITERQRFVEPRGHGP